MIEASLHIWRYLIGWPPPGGAQSDNRGYVIYWEDSPSSARQSERVLYQAVDRLSESGLT